MRIHIFGASGVGATTLGEHLAWLVQQQVPILVVAEDLSIEVRESFILQKLYEIQNN